MLGAFLAVLQNQFFCRHSSSFEEKFYCDREARLEVRVAIALPPWPQTPAGRLEGQPTILEKRQSSNIRYIRRHPSQIRRGRRDGWTVRQTSGQRAVRDRSVSSAR